jgi:hypothetical protein
MVLHCIVCVSHKFVQERRNWLGRKDLQEVEAPPTLLTGAHVRRVSKFHAAQTKKKKEKRKRKEKKCLCWKNQCSHATAHHYHILGSFGFLRVRHQDSCLLLYDVCFVDPMGR